MAKNKTYEMMFAIGGKLQASFHGAFNNAGKNLKSIERQSKAASQTLSNFNSRATAAAQNIERKFKGMGAAVATGLAAAGVYGAGKLTKSMYDSAASLEGLKMTLETVMKDNVKAAETFAWAVDFANKTPFETEGIVEATVRMQSYGINAQKYMTQVGDMASVMGKDIMDAVEAVADAQTGELERMKEFGITKAMIEKKSGEMFRNATVINNKGQIVDQQKFNEALFALMDDRFKGGMERQADSAKGIVSNIQGIWKSGLATISGIKPDGSIANGSFFALIKEQAKSLGSTLETMQSNGTFDRLQQQLANFSSEAIQKFKEALPSIIEFGKTTAGAIQHAWPKVVGFFSFIRDNAPQIIQTAKWLGIAFLSWRAVTTISSAVTTVSTLAGAIGTLRKKYIALTLVKTKDAAQTTYLNGLYAKDALLKTRATIATVAKTAALGVWTGVTTVATAVGSAFGAVMAFITSPIGLVVLAIVALIAIGWLLIKHWDKVKAFFLVLWELIKAGASAVGNALVAAFNWARAGVTAVIQAIVQHFRNSYLQFVAILIAIGAFFITIWTGIRSGAQAAANFFIQAFLFAKNGIVGIFQSIGSTIRSIFAGIVQGIKGSINMVISGANTIIGKINGINIKVPDWVPGIGGKGFGIKIPNIPQLAKGGIATKATLAMIGEGNESEAVLPLSKLNNLLHARPGGGGNHFSYSPNYIIQGNASQDDIEKAQSKGFSEWKRWYDGMKSDDKRLRFEN